MTNDETLSAATIVHASAEAVFGILADPSTHQAIDGTGWVRESLDGKPLTQAGQVFRVAMYHSNHPEGNYEMANRVEEFDPPRTISWQPGQYEAGELGLGGWIWRYDLRAVSDSETEVTLTYDWSAVPSETREHIPFPPFDPSHLDHSLENLAKLAVDRG